jgi:site-specific recombinase XerD
MKISEAFSSFLSFCTAERHVSASSTAKYQDCFKAWLSPTLGSKEVQAVTRMDVLELRQAMVDRQLSIARQYSVIMCLKSLLRFCRTTLGISALDPSEIKLPKRAAPEVVIFISMKVHIL